MSLAWRLFLPISLLVLVCGGGATPFVIRGIIAGADREMGDRLERVADTLVTSGFGLESTLLSRAREVTGVEITLLDAEGAVVTSTLDEVRAGELAAVIRGSGERAPANLGGVRYRIATRPLPPGRGRASLIAVAADTRTTDRLKRDLALPVVIGTGTALLFLIGIVHVIVRTVTRPLAKLADAARDVGGGDLDRRVPAGGARELDVLGREFNAMVGELARSREALLRVEKLAVAGKMAAGVAHEIRNPLSSIRMTVQLLARTANLDTSVQRDLTDIVDEIDRLELALRNLLDLTPAARLDTQLQDLNAVIDDTLRLTARKLAHLKVEVRTELDETLPRLPLDESRARQGFLNVILNAADAMPSGGSLLVTTRRRGECAEVAFEDSGTGLPSGEHGRLFEPFVSTKPGGAGLGLYTVRQNVELHGGKVKLESRSPIGTRCVMTFPLASIEEAPPRLAVGREAS